MLKKQFLTFVFITAITVFTNAQLKYAIIGGINFSNVYSSGLDSNKSVPGPTFSFATMIPVGKLLVKPEIQYSQRGYVIKSENIGGNVNFTNKFKQVIHYVELPIELIYPIETGNGQFFIGAGPVIGAAISGKQKTVLNLLGNRDENTTDLKFGNESNQLKAIDFGGRINVMFVFILGFILKADYNFGFANLSNNNKDFYNRSFGIAIGYLWGSAKK